MTVRLRQAVVAATSLDSVVTELRSSLSLGEPFNDPGVAFFGLRNAVFAIGDTFLEVVSPVQDGTAAGRYIDRFGEGGYMLMFQLDDVTASRERARAAGIREVFVAEHDDITDVHLHPADIGGAIVALDAPVPAASWRWGGPSWDERASSGLVVGAVVRAEDPVALAGRWASVLGVTLDGLEMQLAGGRIRFEKADAERDRGVSEIALSLPADVRRGRDAVEIAGVRLSLV